MRFWKILGLNGGWFPGSFFPKPTQARKHELEIRWNSKTNLMCKELGLVVDIWWWYMAVVVVYGSGGGSGGSIWIWIGGGIWTRIGGGIWIRIRERWRISGGGRWQGR